MGADLFERNIERLVRAAALPTADAAAARERFLRAAGPAPSRSRGVALAAASLLVGALVTWSTLPQKQTLQHTLEYIPSRQEAAVAFTKIPMNGGDSLLRGTFHVSTGGRSPARILRFEGASSLPEETCFSVTVTRGEERFMLGNELVTRQEPEFSKKLLLKDGAFDFQWESTHAALMTVRVAAKDQDQDVTVLEKIRIPESSRMWTFTAPAWDPRILALLEPQLAEVTGLARELRDLIDRVATAAATEESFRPLQKSLSAEATKLRSRAEGLQKSTLYPASALEIASIAQDLQGAMDIFTWKDGKFDGPRSYYTNNQRGKTRRGEAWEFEPLRRHVDDAVIVAGREFGLWIVAERLRGGRRPELVEAVSRSAKLPGIAGFAERLKGEPDATLTDDLRRIR